MLKISKYAVVATSVLALLGCSSTTDRLDGLGISGESKAEKTFRETLGVVPGSGDPSTMDPVARAAFWGTRYDRAPNKVENIVEFSKALRMVNSTEESLKVMKQAVNTHGDKAAIQLELGKSLIANDRAFEAVRPLEKAIALGRGDDWSAYNSYGVALDSIGEHAEARKNYDRALVMAGAKRGVILNNKGLSYALDKDLTAAERTLRSATLSPDGTARIRQNLALVLGFKGRTAEAERLARSDLPPRIADNNAAYFRALVSQPAYWDQTHADNVVMPVFDGPGLPSQPESGQPLPQPDLIPWEPEVNEPGNGDMMSSNGAAPVTPATTSYQVRPAPAPTEPSPRDYKDGDAGS